MYVYAGNGNLYNCAGVIVVFEHSQITCQTSIKSNILKFCLLLNFTYTNTLHTN